LLEECQVGPDHGSILTQGKISLIRAIFPRVFSVYRDLRFDTSNSME
jgi:hypothetical protein